jgi:L-seryl-tRNA(Ser) seleniumtransferase
MLAQDEAALAERAAGLAATLGAAGVACEAVETAGAVGGGTYPDVDLPSRAVELRTPRPADLARALREGDPPVIARVVHDAVRLDVRTVLPGQEDDLVCRVREATASVAGG